MRIEPEIESRRAGADAEVARRPSRRLDQRRVVGQSQVVVRAERKDAPPVDLQVRALSSIDRAQRTLQSACLAPLQLVAKDVVETHG